MAEHIPEGKGTIWRRQAAGHYESSPASWAGVQGTWLTLAILVPLLGWGCTLKFNKVPDSCGDGVLVEGEECDDGNAQDGDGCSRACIVEDGWNCSGEQPSACRPICGDGRLVVGEVCDGDNTGGQTCSSLGLGAGQLGCLPICLFDTSGCEQQPECGNATLDDGEECDDGNGQDGDGCSRSCMVEDGWHCSGENQTDCSPVCGDGLCVAAGGEGGKSCAEDCGALAISAGNSHTCALLADGTAWCWGYNSSGQIGDGTTREEHSPTPVSLP